MPAIKETQCPLCKQVGTLRLTSVLKLKPAGDFSWVGTQTKSAPSERLVLICDACTFSAVRAEE